MEVLCTDTHLVVQIIFCISVQLKLEVESLEADDQLVLAKKESVVLQAKSELFDL